MVLANLLRLFRAARILARHDALFILDPLPASRLLRGLARMTTGRRDARVKDLRPGQRLAKALQALGPSAIKLGQALSTRSDLLGEEMAADLSDLQDRLPPFPGAEARRIIAEDLGRPAEELFPEFDDTPVAAASIAQVHFATSREGHEVAVKVLRPGIETAFQRDFDLFLWLAGLIEWARPEYRRLKPMDSLRALQASVKLEMDLRFEAAAASEMADNFAEDAEFLLPDVDWRHTARRVLTTERIHGVSIDERDTLVDAGHDPRQVLEIAAGAFFKMVFRDGLFHGDLHPGNLFVRADGGLAAVDFGIMGRLDMRTRHALAAILVGFLTRDYRAAAKAHMDVGWVPLDQDLDAFAQACRSIGEPILGRPQSEISMAHLLAQLFQITELFHMETQPQLLLLQKTMLVAEGVGRKLDPEVNMWFLARPMVEAWIRENNTLDGRLKIGADELERLLERAPAALSAAERLMRSLPAMERQRQNRRPGRPLETALLVPLLSVGVMVLALLALGF